jgi:hypothetical protein
VRRSPRLGVPRKDSLQEQYTFHILITKRSRSCAWGPNPRLTEKKVPDNFGFGARQKNFLKRTGHFFGVPSYRSCPLIRSRRLELNKSCGSSKYSLPHPQGFGQGFRKQKVKQ